MRLPKPYRVIRELPKGVYKTRNKEKKKYKAQIWEADTGKVHTIGRYDSINEAAYHRQITLYGHHWEDMPQDLSDAFGFIYEITNRVTGKQYIGKKQFYLWDGPVGGYKCTDPTDDWWEPTAWRKSNWRNYTGSSDDLNNDIKAGKIWDFQFKVICVAFDKLDLHLKEVEEQVNRDVLEAMEDGEFLYYNKNIAGMSFRPPFKKPESKLAKDKSIEEVTKYYLKPRICKRCEAIIPYGYDTCECTESS